MENTRRPQVMGGSGGLWQNGEPDLCAGQFGRPAFDHKTSLWFQSSTLPRAPTIIRREMVMSVDRTGPGVTVEHRLTNESGAPLVVAPEIEDEEAFLEWVKSYTRQLPLSPG
jgi:hypothetical protein